MPTLAERQPAPQPVEDLMSRLPPNFPELPSDIFDRFPSLAEWQEDTDAWWTRAYQALQSNQATVSQSTTAAKAADDSLRVSITEERIERETADGYLEGKYVLTVTAGDVVTGMEITSASAPNGGTVSEVAFQADKFQIYSGTTKKVMFVADAVQDKVRIGGVFTVDGATTSIYVKTTAGAGTYNDANTPFFVDANGRMSLKDKLTWDGTTLSISGSITATTGTIGGWTIGATTISANNAVLDSAGQLVLGTSNDVVYLSATDATYRIWIGNSTAGSAAFRVTKAGVMTATNGVFSGSITSTSGTIGGFTIGATTLSASGIVLDSSTPSLAVGPSGFEVKLFQSGGVGELAIYYSSGLRIELGITALTSFLSLTGGTSATIFLGDATLTNTFTGAIAASGAFSATSFSGAGSSLTSLNASNISSGTLNNARLPSAISVTSLTASGEIRGATARFGTFTAIGAEILTGYITITDDGGTTRKLGVIA